MSRRATIRTRHDDPELVARALRPDNTDEMETVVERDDNESETETEGAVVTHIERETTGGLHSNVDDYAVNLEVAIDVARSGRDRREQREQPADAGSASDADSNTTDTS
ncbi:KEOPS complex Pcc1-like subunit [Haloterrigena salifodinae]|uniref:KEOPS complex Pcc1-like subunit n=1 Tax=Haloterrigena salifodinae TaxID=2675099 RepID=A0A8T8E2P6_9EURY|nr:KEOPS complex subunit Pcc1 [Haloterrigena salifodinae]QRV15651.1 KEOPS complex Pcc1-like subunit [Haloterrigena salifodinae]